jgi:hypothetical protein
MAKSNKPLTKEIVNQRLSGREVEMIGDYVNKDTKTLFRCALNHEWLASPNNVMRGNGKCCPYCAGQAPLSKEIINNRLVLSGKGYSLTGEYVDTSTHTTFECSNGHTWMAKPNNILNGRGCPSCAEYGFNPDKSAWIYVLDFGNFIKYGISNNLKQRLYRYRNNGSYKIVFSKIYKNGNIAQKWERDIKNILGGRYVSREIIPDGWTETLSIEMYEQIISFTNDKYINED